MNLLNANNINNKCIKANTPLQKANDINIQQILDRYKIYNLSDEFEKIVKSNENVFSEEALTPTIIEYKWAEDKNNCFFNTNEKEKNYFPRREFHIPEISNQEETKQSFLSSFEYNSEILSDNKKSESENDAEEEEENDLKGEENKVKEIYVENIDHIGLICRMNKLFNMQSNQLIDLLNGGKNTIDIKDNNLDILINKYLYTKGWKILSIKNYLFNSFEIFEFMTDKILCNNGKLDDYFISCEYSNSSYVGGYFYINLIKNFINYNNIQKANYSNKFIQNDFIEKKQFNNMPISNNCSFESINYFINGPFIHENNNFNFGIGGFLDV